ncbi:hypothetical protein [Streptomyces graminofaciens]|uniref:hypothetical protein n=1 Tax=Streptomyces graminofaciens TaxID=68212 RepID=UPI003306757E
MQPVCADQQVEPARRPAPQSALLVPHGMRHIDWRLAALDGLGLDANTCTHAAVTLFGHGRGQAVDAEPQARAGQAKPGQARPAASPQSSGWTPSTTA